MSTLALVLPGILGVLFVGFGLLIMFNPKNERVLERLQLTPGNISGLASIRSIIGGTIFSWGALLIYGVVAGDPFLLLIVAILLGVAVIGRVVGLVADGRNKNVVAPTVVEIVLIVILLFSYSVLA
jgi:hypothetical protein